MRKIFVLINLLILFTGVAAKDIEIPLGKISENLSIPLIGILLGLIDGVFNPCALSVFFFFMAYLLAIGSKKKCLTLGLTYSLIIFLVYFSFMYGILNFFLLIGYLQLIRSLVGFILMALGIIEIKDFFLYGKWFSLGIPKLAKPTIEKFVKIATLPSAVVLGFLISLVEIPCAGAFPLAYLTILTEKGIKMRIPYLLLYNLFFILPLLILTFLIYLGLMKVEEAEKKRIKIRKYMRLFAGMIMFLLGLAFVLKVI